jgi:hypothetical protein
MMRAATYKLAHLRLIAGTTQKAKFKRHKNEVLCPPIGQTGNKFCG